MNNNNNSENEQDQKHKQFSKEVMDLIGEYYSNTTVDIIQIARNLMIAYFSVMLTSNGSQKSKYDKSMFPFITVKATNKILKIVSETLKENGFPVKDILS